MQRKRKIKTFLSFKNRSVRGFNNHKTPIDMENATFNLQAGVDRMILLECLGIIQAGI
jgi:hypothetical protein